jgi:hypothetical protein
MFKRFYFLFLILAIGVFLPAMARAAVLYLSPDEGSFGPGDTFAVKIKIDVRGRCINTIESELKFSPSLKVVDILTGQSIINIWLSQPKQDDLGDINKSKLIYLAGGIPGGYCGKIPGDMGESNTVGEIIFRVPGFMVGGEELKKAKVEFTDKTRVLLNDGFGTADKLLMRGALFNIVTNPTQKDSNQWQKIIQTDKIPPEPFVIELRRDSQMFNNQYYIIFSTTDKQSGLDHFEVLEIKPGETVGVRPVLSFWDKIFGRIKEMPAWQKVKQIPYLLKDQTLSSVIKVKAVDKAGNERIVEYIPSYKSAPAKPSTNFKVIAILVGIGLIIVSLLALVIVLIIKKFKKKNEISKEN